MKEIRTEKDLQKSYDRIWTDFVLKEEKKYYSWIVELLNIQEKKYFLDVACGAGFMLKEAASRGAKTFGIDISLVAVKKARKESPSSEIKVGSGENIPFDDNFFDYVSCLGSLEHYLHPERGVREISRVLKKDGQACVVLPNRWYWLNCWQGIRHGKEPSHGQELERFYSREEAQQLLEKNGLKVLRTYGYNKKITLAIWKKPFEFFYNRLLYRVVSVNASYQFAFICRKWKD